MEMSPQDKKPPETEQQKAERLKREDDEANNRKREAMGKAGKLWRVTVHYELDNVPQAHYLDNRTWAETLDIRERLFSAGLMVPHDPGTWLVLPPHELKAVFITRQSTFY